MDVEVLAPNESTGDVIADMNTRRGKILSMNPKADKEILKVEAPLSMMFGYSTDLRSRTQGRASFTMTFKRYERMENSLAKQVLEKRGIFL